MVPPGQAHVGTEKITDALSTMPLALWYLSLLHPARPVKKSVVSPRTALLSPIKEVNLKQLQKEKDPFLQLGYLDIHQGG